MGDREGDERPPKKQRRLAIECCGSATSRIFMANVTDDLLWEILIRVSDCRQALRCGSVCVRWLSLVARPEFLRSYIHQRHSHSKTATRSSPPPLLFLQSNPYGYSTDLPNSNFYQMPFPDHCDNHCDNPLARRLLGFLPWFDDEDVQLVIWASFRDLLLVSRTNPHARNNDFLYCICNPMTAEWTDLPEPPRGIVTLLSGALLLRGDTEDQHKSSCCYYVALFGYVFEYNYSPALLGRRDRPCLTVFCSDTRRWSPLAQVPCLPPLPQSAPLRWGPREVTGLLDPFNHAVACGGALHWLDGRWKAWDGVVSFDPSTRQYRLIPPHPDYVETNPLALRLGACQGRLRAAAVSGNSGVFELRVLELNRACNGGAADYRWSVFHDASLGLGLSEDGDGIEAEKTLSVLAHHPSNNDVVFVLADNVRVYRYDMSKRKGDKVGELPYESRQVSVFVVAANSFSPTKLPLSFH